MGVGSLARVLTGWTGSLSYTTGSVDIEPQTRDSVASFLARFVHDALALHGDAWSVSVSAAGIITLGCPGFVDILNFTGNVGTRLGFGFGPEAGETIVAANDATGLYIPTNGLRLVNPLLASTATGPTGDGSGGVSATRRPGTSRIDAWHVDATMLPTLTDEYDYWHDGRVFGRVVLTGARLVPMSPRLRSEATIRVELDAIEVA